MLWLALHLSALPLEALLAALPAEPPDSGPGEPARCVVEQRRVLLACPKAAAAGVQAGMSAASAASLLPGLQLLARDTVRESAFVERLALALARYSPALVIEPDGVLIEVAASLRLFGGARALMRAVQATARASGVNAAQTAAAPTAAAASLLARVAPPRVAPRRGRAGRDTSSDAKHSANDLLLAWHQHTRQRLDGLPLTAALAAWQLPERTAELLHGIGCRTLADVRALPRAGLQRRGGGVLLERLAQAYGEAPDPRPWFTPPPGFELGLELLHRADDAALLVFAAERLVQPLAGWLAQQWLAATRIALHLRHETCRRQTLADSVVRIGLGEASRDARQIGLLLRERLQRTTLPAPVYALTLRLEEAVGHAGREAALWRDPQRHGADGSRGLIDRLAARLGPERVQGLQLQADHRPERAMVAVSAAAAAAAAQFGEPPLPTPSRPAWLLPEPLRLQEHAGRPLHGGPLTLRSRAERIEAGWFDGELVSRDYHVAEGRDHRLRWVFRERRGDAAQWYLHGLFG
jgi:protein ImuB